MLFDLIFISDNLAMFDDFRKAIIQEFEMLDIRLMFYYLNIEIKQVQWNIFISQESYAKTIFNEFNMKSCKPMNIPVECGAKSSKHEDGEKINPILFRRLIGILSFLTCTPRQDIFFLGVTAVGHFIEAHTTTHLKVTRRILQVY